MRSPFPAADNAETCVTNKQQRPKGQDPKGQDPRVNPAATVHSAYPAADVSSLHPIAGSSFALFLLGH
ncbi:hypothetical protein [Synechococcus sp. UW140]|uniref:hypothetical protein n=1 Tax=Synechococcus sp. UW140 TaxID=368503 RepID=UPI003137CD67